jgi:hypothetical protein
MPPNALSNAVGRSIHEQSLSNAVGRSIHEQFSLYLE